jgi:hypothetical protein
MESCTPCTQKPAEIERLRSEALNQLIEATIQGVEESVVNALVAVRGWFHESP